MADDRRHLLRRACKILGARVVPCNLLHRMAPIQTGRRFFDGGRRAVAAALPSAVIRALPCMHFQHLQQKLTQPVGRDQTGIGHMVRRLHVTAAQAPMRRCYHQHRPHRPVMACLMEVLEVECVVPDLLHIRPQEGCGASLELKHEDHAAQQQHGIDALTQTRDHELQKDLAWPDCGQHFAQQPDLFLPGISLQNVDRKLAGRGQRTKKAFLIASQKTWDGI